MLPAAGAEGRAAGCGRIVLDLEAEAMLELLTSCTGLCAGRDVLDVILPIMIAAMFVAALVTYLRQRRARSRSNG